MGVVDIVDCMQDGAASHPYVSRDDAASHPVVAMDDETASVHRPDLDDRLVDDLFLEFHGIADRITGIGAFQIGKHGRVDQVDPFRIDAMAEPLPMLIIDMALPLEAAREIEGGHVAFDAPLRQPPTEGGNHLTKPPALAGNEAGQTTHLFGQTTRLRRNEKNRRFFIFPGNVLPYVHH